jgi:hypothetical protein
MTHESRDASKELWRVSRWMNRGGEYPGDEAAAIAAKDLIDEWLQWRRQNMDVLASTCLNEVVEICEAVKDVI